MIDFKKRLAASKVEKKVDPREIYESLDRKSDKGPLRPAQQAILGEWFSTRANDRDLIVKLHTGQGKTLIGLLLLQSRLNAGHGPAMYLCPNKQLVAQTCAQAEQFGISVTSDEGDLPQDFLDGRSIYVTNVFKLFNGLTKFRLAPKSIAVDSIVVDDAHACIESVHDCATIRLDHTENVYQQLFQLFHDDLECQGHGTFADIRNKRWDALLPVPYWAWEERTSEVAGILSKGADNKAIKFAWSLLKDSLPGCRCIFSGTQLEISPYGFPLDRFGSFHDAKCRIFMSATLADDSFLVKGLGLSAATVQNPLMFKEERWSGEKMVLIPSMMDDALDRATVVANLARPSKKPFGIVAIAPSSESCGDWKSYGATIASKESIDDEIEKLRQKEYQNTLVVVNRYDGIDLPDNMCRILVLDGKPFSDSLVDRVMENTRPDSEVLLRRTAQRIEQGIGRAVRGEKDYCVVVLVGPELVRVVRSNDTKANFSLQTRTQIDVGLDIVEYAREEIESGKDPVEVLNGTISQALKRDEGWKELYTERMNAMPAEPSALTDLSVLETEKAAEDAHRLGRSDDAKGVLQALLDKRAFSDAERGWYLQEMARYKLRVSKAESTKLQQAAHTANPYLLAPPEGLTVVKLKPMAQKRTAAIREWVSAMASQEDLRLAVDEMLNSLSFGVKAEKFEAALNTLGKALGFVCERPDKEWKEGPDNLWLLRDGEYLVFECKNMVDGDRAEINKDETGQMNNACAWFARVYPGVKGHKFMVIPTLMVAKAAGFNESVRILRKKGLHTLVKNARTFFAEFAKLDLRDLKEERLHELLTMHSLAVEDLLGLGEHPKTHGAA
jgi:replicative superfamily II helicase